MFLWLQAPHFVAGIEVGVRAAPIIHYMVGWPQSKIEEYCAKKGWTCDVIGNQ